MQFITREVLLKKRARRQGYVTIAADHPEPELAGKTIIVRSMTSRERTAFETQFRNQKTGKLINSRADEIRERLALASVIDEAGNALLQEDDIASLKELDGAILEAIVKKSQELNDISDDDLATIEKN